MKNIVLIDASPRKDANSEAVVDVLAVELQDCEVTVFKMREKTYDYCLACGACQGKDTQSCVQKDDITALLPIIDQCDGIVLASPVYNHQMSAMAKTLVERFYPFFNVNKRLMSNTSKYGKKAAMVLSCWAGPQDVYQKYADWTLQGFSQIGAEETWSLVFGQIPERGAVLQNEAYMNQLRELAGWLTA